MSLPSTLGSALSLREVVSVGALGGRVFEVPPPAEPFVADPSDANSWSLQTTLRYLKDVIELPQYEANFLRYEVNGYALLCLSQDVVPQLGVTNKFHCAKIALHAQMLRDKVISKAALALPTSMEDWDVVHVAAWVSEVLKLRSKVLKVLRQRIDGQALLDMTEETQKSFFDSFEDNGASDKVANTLQTGLINGVKYNTSRSLGSSQGLSSISENDIPVEASKRGNIDKDVSLNEEDELIVVPLETGSGAHSDLEADADDVEEDDGDAFDEQGSDAPAYDTISSPHESGDAQSWRTAQESPLDVKKDDSSSVGLNTEEIRSIANIPPSRVSYEKKKKDQTVSFDVRPPQDAALRQVKVKANSVQHKATSVELPPPKTSVSTRQPDAPSLMPGASQVVIAPQPTPGVQPFVVMPQLPVNEGSLTNLLSEIVRYNNTTVDNMNQIIRNLVSEKEKFESELARARRQAELTAEMVRDEVKRQSNMQTIVPMDSRDFSKTNATVRSAGTIRDAREQNDVDMSTFAPTHANVKDLSFAANEDNGRDRVQKNNFLSSSNSVADAGVASNTGKAGKEVSVSAHAKQSKDISNISGVPDYEAFVKSGASNGLVSDVVDVEEMLETQSRDERHLWSRVVSKFTSHERVPIPYNDSEVILQDVAFAWIKLGNAMLRFSTATQNKEKGIDDFISCVKGLRNSSIVAISGVQHTKLARSEKKNLQRSAPKPEDSSHNIAHISAAVVFSLALVNKILHKSRTKAGNIDYLAVLRGIRQGGLPFSELSREEMRSFLQEILGLDFTQWHKFDSFCLHADPDKNGFIDFPRLWSVFSHVGPKFDGVATPVGSQRLHLLFLSIASTALSRRKELVQNAIASVISENRHNLRKPKGKPSGKESSDVARLRDVDSIADLLFHIVQIFFESHGDSSSYASTLPDWDLCSYEKNGVLITPKANTRSSALFQLLSSEPSRLRDACFSVANTLNIYNYGEASSVYNAFGSFLLTFCGFRHKVLKSSLETDCELSTFYSQDTEIHSKHRRSTHPLAHMHPSCLVTVQDVNNLLHSSADIVQNLLGAANYEGFLSRSDQMKLEDFDVVISQVLGIAAPCGRGEDIGLALSSSQLDVEAFLLDYVPESLPSRAQSQSPSRSPTKLEGPTDIDRRSKSPVRADTRSASRLSSTLDRKPLLVPISPSKTSSSDGIMRGAWTKKIPKDASYDADVGFILADHLEELNAHSLRMKSSFETSVKLLEAARAIKNTINSARPEVDFNQEQVRTDIEVILRKTKEVKVKAEESITNKTTEDIIHRVAEDVDRGALRDPTGSIARELQTIQALTETLIETKRDISKLCRVIFKVFR